MKLLRTVSILALLTSTGIVTSHALEDDSTRGAFGSRQFWESMADVSNDRAITNEEFIQKLRDAGVTVPEDFDAKSFFQQLHADSATMPAPESKEKK